MEYLRFNVQNVSRRLCNSSFICFTVKIFLISIFQFLILRLKFDFFIIKKLLCSTILLTLYMITILLISKFYLSYNKKQAQLNEKKLNSPEVYDACLEQLSDSFSFVEIIDSQFIGLVVFLLSNVLTGAVNLSINTLKVNNLPAFGILSAYCFVSFAVPYLLYFIFVFNTKKITNQNFISEKAKSS